MIGHPLLVGLHVGSILHPLRASRIVWIEQIVRDVHVGLTPNDVFGREPGRRYWFNLDLIDVDNIRSRRLRLRRVVEVALRPTLAHEQCTNEAVSYTHLTL